MSDLKIADGTVDLVEYGAAERYTLTGLNFVTVPSDASFAEIKIWASGGGGGGRGESAVAKAGDGGGGGYVFARDVPVIPGEDLIAVIGVPGDGGVGSSAADESGDGGAGAGRTHVAKFPSIVTICEAGGGGGGGGVGSGADSSEQFGGQGGPGGFVEGATGGAPGGGVGDLETGGGEGGTQTAGGSGGLGGEGSSGSSGASITGGDGAGDSGVSDGENASGGSPGGGDGGAFDDSSGAGGGGGAGQFGGGGGGRGDGSPSESGGGGGGGSGFASSGSVIVDSAQGSGINGGGQSDPDYPGGSIGTGGLGGLVADDGDSGSPGVVSIRFGSLNTVSTTNDLVIENDAPATVEGVDMIAQHVRAILLICQGEWFLDLAAGTPWFTRVIGHKFNAGQINITVREAILSVDGVASIQDIESTRIEGTRSIDIKVTVLTDQGAEAIIEAEIT